MNVYDFDDTIYKGDSTRDFILYTMKKNPKVYLSLPRQACYGLLFVLKLLDKTKFKQELYSFFKYIPNMDEFINEFVDDHMSKIKPWYIEQQKSDDLIISASPEFILQEFCNRLGINNLIASKVDKKTGKYTGLNCYGEEKVTRFEQRFNKSDVNEFYSDSYSDEPMAKLAISAYIVRDNSIDKWKLKREF